MIGCDCRNVSGALLTKWPLLKATPSLVRLCVKKPSDNGAKLMVCGPVTDGFA